jgi:hypothetical protein
MGPVTGRDSRAAGTAVRSGSRCGLHPRDQPVFTIVSWRPLVMGIAIWVIIILVIAALIKYLLGDSTKK